MILIRGRGPCCALLVFALAAPFATAGEVIAAPACCRKRPATACYDPCCPPCRVGPIRRALRRVFCPCCPPPCPVRLVPVVPAPAATVWVPPPAAIQRPIAPVPPPAPPPPTIPGTGSALRRTGVLTPPTPPPPVRLDRMASRNGSEGW